MSRKPPPRSTPNHADVGANLGANSDTDTDIDALYGLEPVLDVSQPSRVAGEVSAFVDISCPSCGEHYAIEIDLTQGDFSHIEDCQVCCAPMQVSVTFSGRGRLTRVRTQRLDEV